MQHRARMTAMACSTIAAAFALVACGQWQAPSPTSPSDLGGGLAAHSGSGGTVTGTVRNASHAIGNANAVSPMTVTVVGTTIKAVVSVSGKFKLEHVPAGAVRLQFTGGSVNAAVDTGGIHEHETLDLQLTVTVNTVVVDATMRQGEDGTAELEGPVSQISGSCPAATVTVGTWSGTMSPSANDCAQIRVGVRVRLIGRRMSATVIVVVRVEVSIQQGPKPPTPGDDDDDDDGDD